MIRSSVLRSEGFRSQFSTSVCIEWFAEESYSYEHRNPRRRSLWKTITGWITAEDSRHTDQVEVELFPGLLTIPVWFVQAKRPKQKARRVGNEVDSLTWWRHSAVSQRIARRGTRVWATRGLLLRMVTGFKITLFKTEQWLLHSSKWFVEEMRKLLQRSDLVRQSWIHRRINRWSEATVYCLCPMPRLSLARSVHSDNRYGLRQHDWCWMPRRTVFVIHSDWRTFYKLFEERYSSGKKQQTKEFYFDVSDNHRGIG